jgi:hypothetical protein
MLLKVYEDNSYTIFESVPHSLLYLSTCTSTPEGAASIEVPQLSAIQKSLIHNMYLKLGAKIGFDI